MDVIRQGYMCPAVQVMWLQDQAEASHPAGRTSYYFVRLCPHVRYADSTLQLDGSRAEPVWKTTKRVGYPPDSHS